MSIGDISLTAGMRNNLVSLQNTAKLVATTQQHLSTGKKVNSALDNPVEFFASQSMLNTANDLSSYKDGMSNAIQMVQAANTTITGLTSLIAQAKSIAQSVIGGTPADRTAAATQYSAVLSQMDLMQADAGFQGVNLLKSGATYDVAFGSGTDKLTLTGQDATSVAGLGLVAGGTSAWAAESNVTTDLGLLDAATAKLRGYEQILMPTFQSSRPDRISPLA